MRRIAFILFTILLNLYSAQAQTMTPEDFIGKWTPVDTSGKEAYYNFMDNEHVEVSLEGNLLKAKYTITTQGAKTILSLLINGKQPSSFIVLNKTADSFLLCIPKDYVRAIAATQATGNEVSWGWSKPFTQWKRIQL